MACCAECGHQIDYAKTNFQLPPWCPGCGADLKLGDRKPELRTPKRRSSVGGETPPNPGPEPTPVATEAFAWEPAAPAAPPRRPRLSSEPRAELPMPDGYLLTGAEDASQKAIEGFRRELWYYSAAAVFFLALVLYGVSSSVEKLRSWKRAQGTVSEVNYYVTRRGFGGETYTFTYFVAGKEYKAGRWFDMTLGRYKQGEPVTVVYSPTDPAEGMVLSFSNLWGWPIAAMIPTLFCALVAVSSVVLRRVEERAAR